MSLRIHSLVAALAVALASLMPVMAEAVEPSVEVSGGGLAFAPNAALSIETQDVVIAPAKLAVTYAIRNSSTDAQTILIAFPMPDLDANIVAETDVTLPDADTLNFVRANTTVDGQPVATRIEQRAMAVGLDVSATLKSFDLPLFPFADGVGLKIEALDPAKRQELIDSGILKEDGGVIVPAWTLKSVAFWKQKFNAGQTVTIAHSYIPITAVSDYSEESLAPVRDRVCLAPPVESAIAKLTPDAAVGAVKITTVGFNSVAGADGLGAARRFRLIIEMADPKTIVSTCWDGMKKTGPMQMEWSSTDFVQSEDLSVMFAR